MKFQEWTPLYVYTPDGTKLKKRGAKWMVGSKTTLHLLLFGTVLGGDYLLVINILFG